MEDTTADASYARYLPRQRYLYSYGWGMNNTHHGVTNNEGFSHSNDFSDEANVLVIGDSFIESFMVEYSDTVQGQLDATLGKVYAASASGNGLADTLQLARKFVPAIHPKTAVIFVDSGNVNKITLPYGRGHNYFSFSGNNVKVEHNPYVQSRMKMRVLKSALLRYLYYNLKFTDWFSTTFAQQTQILTNVGVQDEQRAQREQALEYFMRELVQLQRQYGTRFVFLVDGDRKEIYTPGKAVPEWTDSGRLVLLKHIRESDFRVVDMQPYFQDHWDHYRERMDSLPMDGHWNSVGHRLAAEALLSEQFPARVTMLAPATARPNL